MVQKKPRVITISATPSLVRVAQVSAAGVVEKLAKQAVEKNAVDAALRKALTGFDIKRSGILWVLPAEVATAKSLDVPSTDSDEIASILSLQAARHTPFNKDEILVSYVRTGTPKPNVTRVLLVVVKRDTVKEKMVILKSAGLAMDSVLFASEGIGRFYAQQLKVRKGDAPFAILDVTMQGAAFTVQVQGQVVMSRSIPVGLEHLAIDPEAPKQIADELKASLEAYDQAKIDRRPARILLTSANMALGSLASVLGEAAGIPVETKAYPSLVNGGRPIQEMLARDFADETALDIIACGVTAARCQAELIPQEIRDQRAVAEKGRQAFLGGVFFFLALFFFGVALLGQVYFKGKFLQERLVDGYKEQRQAVQDLQTRVARAGMVRDYLEGREVPLNALRELYEIIARDEFHRNTYLTAVGMDDMKTMVISGISGAESQVQGLVTALKASPLFGDIDIRSTSVKKDRGKDAVAFEIAIGVAKDAASGNGGRP